MPLRREPTPGGRRCAISLSEAQRYGRSRQGWALPPPRRCQSDMNQPDQTSIRRVHARQPVHDSATIIECESSAGGGSGVLAQQCSGGLAEEAPSAEGQQALRGFHNERVCVCVKTQSKRWGAQLSQVCALPNLCERGMANRVSRAVRARPLVAALLGPARPPWDPLGVWGGDQYHSIQRVLGFFRQQSNSPDTYQLIHQRRAVPERP